MHFKWILIMSVILLLARTAAARDIIQGDDCTIAADQVIEDNVFVLCRTFELNGHIKGNLIGAAFDVELNGPVDGNIYMLAGQMDVRDHVGRDLLFAGPVLRVHPTTIFDDTRSDVTSFSLSTEIFDGAHVPGSVISLSYQLVVAGDVDREVSFWGSALRINPTVAGDVDATVGDAQMGDASQLQTLLTPFRFDVRLLTPGLIVAEEARINGQLTYTSTQPGEINGTLGSAAVFQEIVTTPDFTQINNPPDNPDNTLWLTSYVGVIVREFVTLGAIGLLGIYFLPRPLLAPVQHLRARPLNSLGTGILTFILSIGIWILLLLLILLIMLIFLTLNLPDLVIVGALAIGVLNIGTAGAFYFVAIYISRIVVCLAVGRLLVRLTLGDDSRLSHLNLLVGVALFSVLIYLPLVGSIVNGLTLALGLGAIFLTINQLRGTPRRQAVPIRLPAAPEDARQMPPPIVGDAPRGPGMNNLPSGFHWWED